MKDIFIGIILFIQSFIKKGHINDNIGKHKTAPKESRLNSDRACGEIRGVNCYIETLGSRRNFSERYKNDGACGIA